MTGSDAVELSLRAAPEIATQARAAVRTPTPIRFILPSEGSVARSPDDKPSRGYRRPAALRAPHHFSFERDTRTGDDIFQSIGQAAHKTHEAIRFDLSQSSGVSRSMSAGEGHRTSTPWARCCFTTRLPPPSPSTLLLSSPNRSRR